MTEFAYEPAEINVELGETVRLVPRTPSAAHVNGRTSTAATASAGAEVSTTSSVSRRSSTPARPREGTTSSSTGRTRVPEFIETLRVLNAREQDRR